MGGFSDNYECGYWGDETPPKQMNKKVKNNKSSHLNVKKSYTVTDDDFYKYLNVMLTSIDLLGVGEQEERTNLIKLCNIETVLELIYTKDIHKNIEIYYDEVHIGRVQKIFEDEGIDNTKIVDDFCFVGDELKDIEAIWTGDIFCLRVQKI